MSEDDLARVHQRLAQQLEAAAAARLDAIFHCPHGLDSCDCRKPDAGLFLQARERWPEIDLGLSAMVGDSEKDVLAGERLGMTTVHLGHDAPDLAAAIDWLLGEG